MNRKMKTLIMAGMLSLGLTDKIHAEETLSDLNENVVTEEEQPDPGPMGEMGKPIHDPDSPEYQPYQPDPGPMGEMGRPSVNETTTKQENVTSDKTNNIKVHKEKDVKIENNIKDEDISSITIEDDEKTEDKITYENPQKENNSLISLLKSFFSSIIELITIKK